MFKRVLLTIGVLVLLVIVFYFFMGAITKYTGFFVSSGDGEMNSVGDCLSKRDIQLYINSDDVVKSLRGSEVIDVLDEVEIINCLRDNERCLDEGVDEFPMWIVNGIKLKKDISLFELLDYSECNV